MSRIDINKDEREADNVIQQAINSQPNNKSEEGNLVDEKHPRSYKSAIFKAITEANKGRRGDMGMSYMDVVNRIPEPIRKLLSDEIIKEILLELDMTGQIHYDITSNRIYA